MSVGRALMGLKGPLQQQHLRALEASFDAASRQFGSYNFREYFGRKTRHKFGRQLPGLLGTPAPIDDRVLASIDAQTARKLHDWWLASLDELAVLQRAAAVNSLFKAPLLVVEQSPASLASHSQSARSEHKSPETLPDHPTDPKRNT